MLFDERRFTLKDGRTAVLRVPDVDDAPALIEYLKRTAAETNFLLREPEECDYTLEEERGILERFRRAPNSLMLCCFVDGQLAGNCNLMFNDKLRIRHRASVAIALYRAYWGLGIGTAMLNTLIRAARERGVRQLELEYIEGNARGRALYEKLGFVPYAVHPDAIRLKDGTSLNEICMLKRL